MLEPFEATKRWKWLKEQISKIKDPILHNAIMAEFNKRAIHEWGFCPDNTVYKSSEQIPVLDNYEQNLLERIKAGKEYGFFQKDESIPKEAHARMMQFIETGGILADIPEDICTDTIIRLYHDCMQEYGDNLLAEADRLIGVQQ